VQTKGQSLCHVSGSVRDVVVSSGRYGHGFFLNRRGLRTPVYSCQMDGYLGGFSGRRTLPAPGCL
jgi:hypothetical protein